MSYACGGVLLMLAVAAGVEQRRVRGDDGGDGARVDDDAGQRRPGGQGEAGSQAQGPETTCGGAQQVRCLLLLCFRCTAGQSRTISTSTLRLWYW